MECIKEIDRIDNKQMKKLDALSYLQEFAQSKEKSYPLRQIRRHKRIWNRERRRDRATELTWEGREGDGIRTFRGTAQQTAAHSIFPRCVARFRNGLHLYYHFPPPLLPCPAAGVPLCLPQSLPPPHSPLSGIGQTLVHNLLRRRSYRNNSFSPSLLPPSSRHHRTEDGAL